MNISAPFIRRPIATALLMIGLLLGGLVSYRLLPVAALPNVNYPTIQITAQLPGADPQTMASSVACRASPPLRVAPTCGIPQDQGHHGNRRQTAGAGMAT
jgi:Cu/Ag efflux pump CusA